MEHKLLNLLRALTAQTGCSTFCTESSWPMTSPGTAVMSTAATTINALLTGTWQSHLRYKAARTNEVVAVERYVVKTRRHRSDSVQRRVFTPVGRVGRPHSVSGPDVQPLGGNPETTSIPVAPSSSEIARLTVVPSRADRARSSRKLTAVMAMTVGCRKRLPNPDRLRVVATSVFFED
jgi:hypothetical protein